MSLNHNSVTSTPTKAMVLMAYAGLFFIWSLYRAFFHNSVWTEEIFIKGIIFLLPIIFLPLTDKEPIRSLGITTTNFFKSVSIGIGVGFSLGLAGVLVNFIRFSSLSPSFFRGLSAGQIGAYLILAIITAFWEQLLFSGYFLAQLKSSVKQETSLIILIGILFSLIHFPAYYLIQHQPFSELIVNLSLLISLGAGCAILQLRTKNLIAPIMAHVLWGVTIFIFR